MYITDIAAWCTISFYDYYDSCNPLYGANLYLNGSLITNLTIPEEVTEIANFAFSGCNLRSITISDNVTTIGERAFTSCNNLEKVIIGNGVTKIGYMAFGLCSKLNEVYCQPIVPPTAVLSGSVWSGFTSTDLRIYVPNESVDTYKARNGWKEFKSNIVGYSFQ